MSLDLRVAEAPALSVRTIRRMRSRTAKEVAAEIRGGANTVKVRRVVPGLSIEVTTDRSAEPRIVDIEGRR